jgi:hypothetical protein
VHNNLRAAASDHNTPEISGRRHTGTTLKASPERLVLTVHQVYALADAIESRYRAMPAQKRLSFWSA